MRAIELLTTSAFAIEHVDALRKCGQDAVIWGHEVRRLECSRSSSRKHDSFCISADNGNLFNCVGVQRQKGVGIFKQDNRFCGDFAHESCVFGTFDGTFKAISVEDLQASALKRARDETACTHFWYFLSDALGEFDDLASTRLHSSHGQLP